MILGAEVGIVWRRGRGDWNSVEAGKMRLDWRGVACLKFVGTGTGHAVSHLAAAAYGAAPVTGGAIRMEVAYIFRYSSQASQT